MAAFDIATSMR